jgi:hypothetical protein
MRRLSTAGGGGAGTDRRARWTRIGFAMGWLCLVAWLVADFGGIREGVSGPVDRGSRVVLAQGGVTPSPTAVPAGTWRALHAPRKAPLWTGGDTTRARPCGHEDRSGGERRGLVAPLCGIDMRQEDDGAWIGWAAGEEGLLARYADGMWQKVDDLEPRKTNPKTYHLHDVFVAAADDVWAVGWVEGDRACIDCGVILHYDGRAWRQLERSEFGINSCVPVLNAIDMQKDEAGAWFGWIMGNEKDCLNGGAVVIGYDGEAWKWFRAPQLSINMHDVRILSRQEAWAVGELGSESYFDGRDGKFGDWPLQGRSGAHSLFAVDLADPTYGWDGGVIGRLNRYDGNCHDGDPDTPCWFDNQANPIKNAQGNKVTNSIYGIDMLSRTEGWLVGKEDSRISMIAHFAGDGARWDTVPVAEDPGKSLFDLFMLSERQGFAVGDEGVILEYTAAALPTAIPPTATATPTATRTATQGASATTAPSITPSPPSTPTPTVTTAATVSPTPTASEPSATAPTPATGTPTRTGIPTEATPARTGTPRTPTPTATGTRRTATATQPPLPIKAYLPIARQVRPRR